MQPDEKTFRDLVHRHRDMIWRLCRTYRLGAAWETEDAFHEVLCALWQGMDSYAGRSSEQTWVYRVATNTLISLTRRISNQPSAPPPEQWNPSGSDEGLHDLVQLIETLPEPDYTIVRAHAEGFNYKEIAKITKLSAGAVGMRLTRALHKLRKQLGE